MSARLLFVAALALCAAALLQVPSQQQPFAAPLYDAGHGDGPQSSSLPFSTTAFEEYVEDVMERWHAPGLAVAVINGNSTWAKVSDAVLLCPQAALAATRC